MNILQYAKLKKMLGGGSTKPSATIPEGYIKPKGRLRIRENGEYDVSKYAKATVAIPAALIVRSESELPEDAPIETMAVVIGDSNTFSSTFLPIDLGGEYSPEDMWTDGTNTYYSSGGYTSILNGGTWESKTFKNTPDDLFGRNIWTDGTNIYYSSGTDQYVLNKETDTWEPKVWKGLISLNGPYIWTDGTNMYYSCDISSERGQYILNGDTWEPKVWKGLPRFSSTSIWTDGTNIYYSSGTDQYVLNKETDTWEPKVWKGLISLNGPYIWTDGTNMYSSSTYVLNKETDTWEPKVWKGFTYVYGSAFYGSSIWTDGTNIYCYYNGSTYILLPSNSKFLMKKPNSTAWIEISPEEVIPDGYVKPEGELEITENGPYDVAEYASAKVNVPAPEGDTLAEFLKDRDGSNLFYERPITKNMAELLTAAASGGILTNASRMFYRSDGISNLKLFDTSNVTNMSYMFYYCSGLQYNGEFHLCLDTSNVKDMSNMFSQTLPLKKVPLFNTSNVTNMSYMFYITGLTDCPAFDTSNVTDMSYMFYSSQLTTMPLLDTSNVTNMSYMFYGCPLTTMPLLDTSNVTNMNSMFLGCPLTTMPLLDTSNVTNMTAMFRSCTNLTSIPLLDTSNVTNMSSMFAANGNESCGIITVPSLDTSKVTSMYCMFEVATNLTTVEGLDTRNVTNMGNMFYKCVNITNICLRNIKTSLQVGSGTSWGHLLTVESLTHLIYELRDTGSTKTLTVGSANLEKLANVYVKLVDITDEMRAEDDLIDEKLPFEVCESTDEGATLITDYVTGKHWVIK